VGQRLAHEIGSRAFFSGSDPFFFLRDSPRPYPCQGEGSRESDEAPKNSSLDGVLLYKRTDDLGSGFGEATTDDDGDDVVRGLAWWLARSSEAVTFPEGLAARPDEMVDITGTKADAEALREHGVLTVRPSAGPGRGRAHRREKKRVLLIGFA
jgi:hypothetical protein